MQVNTSSQSSSEPNPIKSSRVVNLPYLASLTRLSQLAKRTPNYRSTDTYFGSLLCLTLCLLQLGCGTTNWDEIVSATELKAIAVESSANRVLSRADGVCLARVIQVVEKNEMPSDGDHFEQVSITPIYYSGKIPDWIRVVIQHGGNMPYESIVELEKEKVNQLIQPRTLIAGELHWFVFSDAYDSSRYPYRVAGWWRYSENDVPKTIIEAIDNDRLRLNRKYDEGLDLMAVWNPTIDQSTVTLHHLMRAEKEDKATKIIVPGHLDDVAFVNHSFSDEMQLPDDYTGHILHLVTHCYLGTENPFGLPPGRYRINHAYEIESAQKHATWVAANQENFLMLAFKQYNPITGLPLLSMKFDLLEHGGLEAGSDTEHWYRKIVTNYQPNGNQSKSQFRHQYIKTGQEPIDSSNHWLPIQSLDATPPANQKTTK